MVDSFTIAFRRQSSYLKDNVLLVIDCQGKHAYYNNISEFLPIRASVKNDRLYKIINNDGVYELRKDSVYCGKFDNVEELMIYLSDIVQTNY